MESFTTCTGNGYRTCTRLAVRKKGACWRPQPSQNCECRRRTLRRVFGVNSTDRIEPAWRRDPIDWHRHTKFSSVDNGSKHQRDHRCDLRVISSSRENQQYRRLDSAIKEVVGHVCESLLELLFPGVY